MTASLALDTTTASQLAAVDPALAPLSAALSEFADGTAWVLHDVVWTPDTGCRLAYQVVGNGHAREASPHTTSTFVDVNVTSAGWSQRDYREDDALPGLTVAADPVVAKRRLAHSENETFRGCRMQPVRYRPSQRAVLRYEVETSSGQRTYYAKVFQPERFAAIAPVMMALSSQPRGLVAPLTAMWGDADAVVVRGVSGISVSAALGDRRTAPDERILIGRRLGKLLAQFHAQAGVPAPAWRYTDQLTKLDQTLVAARRADPGLARRLDVVRELLGTAPPPKEADVLTHGSFRPGQVVMDGEGHLVLLDTDGVCRSDPSRDLGTLLAHLGWQGIRQPSNGAVLERVSADFLRAYQAEAGPIDRHALNWWQATGLVLIAARRFRRLETGDWGHVPELVDRAQALLSGDRHAKRAASPDSKSGDLLDCRRMSQVISRALESDAGRRVTVEAAHPLASAAGRRSVVRYDVRGLDGPGASSIVGKSFVDPLRAAMLDENLRLLWAAAATSSTPGLRTSSLPEPLGHVPEFGLVLYRHREGTPLSQLTDVGARLDAVCRAAQWLAAFHAHPVTLRRRLDLDREAANVRAWADVIGATYPDLQRAATRLAEDCATTLCCTTPTCAVPLHKDFHPGHVLVGEVLHIIDLDEARQGNRAFDLAHFSAYAQIMEGEGAGPLLAAFRREYAAVADWPEPRTVSTFEAYAWLKIARQWTVSASPFDGASPARRRAGVRHALERGARCLTG